MEIINGTLATEREKIDIIDNSIITLLDLRIKSIGEIARIKRIKNIPILDKSREEKILNKIKDSSKNSDLIIPVFQTIMNQSKRFQEKKNGN